VEGLLIIRRSPVVIIRDLIALQVAAALIYFILALLADYGALYREVGFHLVSYEVAKTTLILLVEAILIVYIFLRWFFWSTSIHDDLIVVERNIIFKKRFTYPFEKNATVAMHQGVLGKLFFYGTIVIKSPSRSQPVIISYVPEPEKNRKLILEKKQSADVEELNQDQLLTILKLKEDDGVEFKSSFRWDFKENKINRNLEKAAMKNVAAFLNSTGGHIILGVNDCGEILGLDKDFESLTKKDRDGFENHLTQVFNSAIGSELRRFVKVRFHDVDDKLVCALTVQPSNKPAYLKFDNVESFYIRTGNSTTALNLSNVNDYIKSRRK